MTSGRKLKKGDRKMPVFDFSGKGTGKAEEVCTYTTFISDAKEKSPEDPILVISNKEQQWKHHTNGLYQSDKKDLF